MDDKGKDKSNLGNDQKLNREKNPVTGVKTIDQILEDKKSNDVRSAELMGNLVLCPRNRFDKFYVLS
jgi:hypothetical protein